MKVSWNGREVHNPLAKVVIIVGLVTVIVPIGIVTLPISIPLHFGLKKLGRKGFFREKGIVFDLASFQKA